MPTTPSRQGTVERDAPRRSAGEATDVSFLDMFMSLSTALDLVNPRLGDHHKLTCCIAASLGAELGLEMADYNRLFSSALVHDIGATSLVDRLKLLEFEEVSPHDHARLGAVMLECSGLLADQAPVVRHHHVRWDDGRGQDYHGEPVDPLSHIIYLADRIAIQLDPSRPLLPQAREIRNRIMVKSGSMFAPEAAEAFGDLSHDHAFWLKMDGRFLDHSVSVASRLPESPMDLSALMRLSRVYAFIIDSRSRFTASHSGGVAAVAEFLGDCMGLDRATTQRLKIAGYLHDIGKLSVPNDVLEKAGKLDEEERLIIKGHSFYTFKILSQVRGLGEIVEWASQHHELLDGSGYPHGLSSGELDLEARILTVADIFTALTETRPYRAGMTPNEALRVLEGMVEQGQVDPAVFAALADNAEQIDDFRADAQTAESKALAKMWKRAQESLKAMEQ